MLIYSCVLLSLLGLLGYLIVRKHVIMLLDLLQLMLSNLCLRKLAYIKRVVFVLFLVDLLNFLITKIFELFLVVSLVIYSYLVFILVNMICVFKNKDYRMLLIYNLITNPSLFIGFAIGMLNFVLIFSYNIGLNYSFDSPVIIEEKQLPLIYQCEVTLGGLLWKTLCGVGKSVGSYYSSSSDDSSNPDNHVSNEIPDTTNSSGNNRSNRSSNSDQVSNSNASQSNEENIPNNRRGNIRFLKKDSSSVARLLDGKQLYIRGHCETLKDLDGYYAKHTNNRFVMGKYYFIESQLSRGNPYLLLPDSAFALIEYPRALTLSQQEWGKFLSLGDLIQHRDVISYKINRIYNQKELDLASNVRPVEVEVPSHIQVFVKDKFGNKIPYKYVITPILDSISDDSVIKNVSNTTVSNLLKEDVIEVEQDIDKEVLEVSSESDVLEDSQLKELGDSMKLYSGVEMLGVVSKICELLKITVSDKLIGSKIDVEELNKFIIKVRCFDMDAKTEQIVNKELEKIILLLEEHFPEYSIGEKGDADINSQSVLLEGVLQHYNDNQIESGSYMVDSILTCYAKLGKISPYNLSSGKVDMKILLDVMIDVRRHVAELDLADPLYIMVLALNDDIFLELKDYFPEEVEKMKDLFNLGVLSNAEEKSIHLADGKKVLEKLNVLCDLVKLDRPTVLQSEKIDLEKVDLKLIMVGMRKGKVGMSLENKRLASDYINEINRLLDGLRKHYK